jgi:opacity protein-like surface antigen
MARTRHFAVWILATTVVLSYPASARADIRLTAFGGVASLSKASLDDSAKRVLGAAVTTGGLIGVEFDVARIPIGALTGLPIVDVDAHVTTYMGNMVVRLPSGPIQPYGSAGVGFLRVTGDLTIPRLGTGVSASAGHVAWNVGGGVYVLPTRSFGVRADVRRFQTGDLTWKGISGIGDLPLPTVEFWRATLGVTLKF